MGLLLSLGNLDVSLVNVSLVKKFIFFLKCLDFYGSVDCFVVKSEFKGIPRFCFLKHSHMMGLKVA